MMNTEIFTTIARRNKYIKNLKELQATTADKSVNLEQCGIKKSMIFNKLLKLGIIKRTHSNRYYLDEIKEKSQKERRQDIMIIILIAVISAIILSLIFIDHYTGDRILMMEKW